MKIYDLIKFLENASMKYGNIPVDINNGDGIYENITGMHTVTWMSDDGEHRCVELMHNGTYNENESLIK